jgi:hypothetical protein
MMIPFYSVYTRIYSLFYLGVTSICIVAGFGAIMAWFYSMDAPASFDPYLEWFGFSQRRFEEAMFTFDIDVDLTRLIHVNTHLFYTYILAEWGTADDDQHSSILWNLLVQRENPHYIAHGVEANFTFRQVGKTMKHGTVNLTLCIQQVPFVGFFRTKRLVSKTFTLPEAYKRQEGDRV